MAANPYGTGVYWTGTNGSTYIKASNTNGVLEFKPGAGAGVVNLSGLKQIADPNAPVTTVTAPSNPTGSSGGSGSSGGGGGTTYADKSNDIAIQNAGLGATDQQTQAGIAKINATLATLFGNYDAETAANQTNYTNNSNTNRNQLETGKQTALVNAANGRQGLLGTLASIGALSGDGITEANNAVQHGANVDLSGAANTYGSNQSGLDTAWGTYQQQDKSRRNNAQTAANNDIEAAQNSGATAKQTFLSNLANDYAAEGNSAAAKQYSDQAAALYPTIAATNVPTSSISAETAAYTPATLASYLSGSNTLVSTAAPSGTGTSALSLPGLVASTATKKQQTPVAAVA